jgi:3-deoxy-manno-octulosonate cytidylyltransferase (CMP-KDO synthetase)
VQALIENDWADVSTAFCDAASAEEVLSANTVKVVTAGEQAIYFSRSPIPFPRHEVEKYGSLKGALAGSKDLVSTYKIHCGIYAYRRKVLEKFAETEPAELERTEKLEQLRALSFGAKFVIVKADSKSIGVDTKEDLELARSLFSKKADTKADKE